MISESASLRSLVPSRNSCKWTNSILVSIKVMTTSSQTNDFHCSFFLIHCTFFYIINKWMFPLNIVVHHSNQLNINDFTNIIFIFFYFLNWLHFGRISKVSFSWHTSAFVPREIDSIVLVSFGQWFLLAIDVPFPAIFIAMSNRFFLRIEFYLHVWQWIATKMTSRFHSLFLVKKLQVIQLT